MRYRAEVPLQLHMADISAPGSGRAASASRIAVPASPSARRWRARLARNIDCVCLRLLEFAISAFLFSRDANFGLCRIVTRACRLPPLNPGKDANYRHEQCSQHRHRTYATLEPQLLSPLFGQLPRYLGSLVGCLRLTLKPRALDLQCFLARLPQLLYISVFFDAKSLSRA